MSQSPTLQKEKFELTEFKNILFEPVIDLAEILDYADRPILLTLPYFRKHNLLPFFPKGKWQLKISFAQLIWLRIIDKLRQFSYKVADMQRLCDYFFKDAYEDNLAKQNIIYNIEQHTKMKIAGTISIEDDKTLTMLRGMENDNVLQYGLNLDVNYLTNLIIQCINQKEDTGILVFPEGKVLEYDSGGFGNHKQEYPDPGEPHFHLSIKYFLKEFIDHEEWSKLIMPRLLDENERKVLKELNNKNIVELRVKKGKDGNIRLDTIKEDTITGAQAKEIRRILGLGNYEEITMSTRDAKTLHFKKTRKNINSD